jgi:hypothetical protein
MGCENMFSNQMGSLLVDEIQEMTVDYLERMNTLHLPIRDWNILWIASSSPHGRDVCRHRIDTYTFLPSSKASIAAVALILRVFCNNYEFI